MFMVFGFWLWVFSSLYLVLCTWSQKFGSFKSQTNEQDQRLKSKSQSPAGQLVYSIDILNAAAVPQGAKIKESTVTELSK